MSAQSSEIIQGSWVWVEDPVEAWIDGQVLEVKGDIVKIRCTSGNMITVELSKVFSKDMEAPSGGVDNMTELSYSLEPGVLQNLNTRYKQDKIYTYAGNILIAINPFKKLPCLDRTDMMEKYKGAPMGEQSPHVFSVADAAYRAMVNEGGSQSILISGKSGVGKTETQKMIMKYLTHVARGQSGTGGENVDRVILESNPVLEAFGNAKTIKNNNSSRFGKLVEIQFDENGRMSGAAVRTYLLERSRVCQINDPERNYHCFYRLCAAPDEDIKKYKLGNPESFHYLNQSKCFELEGVSDTEEYLATRRAMDVVGISKEDQDAIFRIVASILHLGNIEFVNGPETNSSVIKDEKSRFHLNMTAELLKCHTECLENALLKRAMVVREEVIPRNLDRDSAIVSRDGLAKIIYSRLFNWLVNNINLSIDKDPNSKLVIRVLDIHGFENFKINSFEQFFINFTNEKVQQYFIQHFFKTEQEEYTNEGIDWSYIEFDDNQDKPGGIIGLLDEQCMLLRSRHETFVSNLYQKFEHNKRFKKSKKQPESNFIISHYAGEVEYQADYFLSKNKGAVVAEYRDLLNTSECSIVSGLFPPLPARASKTPKYDSMCSRFKQQFDDLVKTLGSREPHYIICIKPNDKLKPALFERSYVYHQLQYAGVLNAIKISRVRYASQQMFGEFFQRFNLLAPETLDGNYDEKTACQKILDKVGLTGYQLGKTKVFLKAGQMIELDARRAEVIGRAATTIQRISCTYLTRKSFLRLSEASIQLQSYCRAILVRKLYEHMRREAAAIKIQKHLRRYFARESYAAVQSCATTLQTGFRAKAARNEFKSRKHTKAAILIQAQWRCHRDYSYYKNLHKATLTYQCAWRQRLARREFQNLKQAAMEIRALKESKKNLEKCVEELTSCLQLEKQIRADLEKAKAEKIANLQEALHHMQLQVDEAKDMAAREPEAAWKDIDALTAEVGCVKTLLEEATGAAKNAQGRDNEILKKVEDVKTKVEGLQGVVQRLEQKISVYQVFETSTRICVILAAVGVVLLSR